VAKWAGLFPVWAGESGHDGGDREKYATYKHGAATVLSYADQRYYATGAGRFMSADRYRRSIILSLPDSWSRYSYVMSDPVNSSDRTGLGDPVPGSGFCVAINNADPGCQRCPPGFVWDFGPAGGLGSCVVSIR
jgi:RHS repeat-associated protein